MTNILLITKTPEEILPSIAHLQDRCAILTAHGPEAVAKILADEKPVAAFYEKSGIGAKDHYRLPYQSDCLKWIQVAGSGYEHLLPLDREDITVTNAAGLLSAFLAETVIGAMAAMNSGLIAYHQDQARKIWQTKPFTPLREKTLLIVGLGHIGGFVADYAKAMGMRVIGLRRSPSPRDSVDVLSTPKELDRYLPEADVISVHLRMSPETAHCFNADRFARMKPGALFLNTARGGVVDETALLAALDNGKLGGAYLDVFETEPLPQDSPLWSHEKVLVSPHGADTVTGMDERYATLFAENLERFLSGNGLKNIIRPTS